MRIARLVGGLVTALVVAGCGDTTAASSPLEERLDAMDDAVAAWAAAPTLAEAQAAAEAARNLVVGPAGPLYGDADGDGTVAGASELGLLPGLDGTAGIAEPSTGCAVADVLGGPWDDPEARWATMIEAIDAWAPDHNTFPALPSHPQRVVGWATLTLEAGSLELAHEYAGHARLHADVTRAAYETC